MARKKLAEQELALRVWSAYNFTCAACGAYAIAMQGREIPSYRDCTRAGLTVDHVIPEKVGGPTTEENLQCLCKHCNEKKNGTINVARLPMRDREESWVKQLHNRLAWENFIDALREFNKQDAN